GLPPAWEAARQLPTPQTFAFEFETDPTEDGPYFGDLFDRPSRVDPERGPGRGVRHGMVATGPDSIAIQSSSGVHLVDLSGARPRRDLVIDPKRLVEEVFGRVGRAQAARRGGAPGWGHEPRLADDALVCVVGRTQPGRGPNSLVAIDLDSMRPRA
ncbi:MAG: hypothetical protein P1V81_18505, partial [Planctomycetota bacterium]|nr:hypothetical protein [Planctomycetota bacterium]